jgi:pSer/pThr/pTyr-binding forkhead associated (FHA) protein
MSVAGALLTTGLAVAASVVTAMVTARLQASAELRKWQREIRLSYVEAASIDVDKARRVATQFAVGFIKSLDTDERERYFIPANVRITVGRAPENDIAINDTLLSWRHCSFVSEKAVVYLEDLGSTNRTIVNDEPVNGRRILVDKDIICLGHTRFEYRSL